MKVAVIGSRDLVVDDLSPYLPPETTEIISGGARGIDSSAAEYARAHGIKLTEFLPEYKKYGRAAPLRRNEQIVDNADMVVAIWDGASHGTLYTINYARKHNKQVSVVARHERSDG